MTVIPFARFLCLFLLLLSLHCLLSLCTQAFECAYCSMFSFYVNASFPSGVFYLNKCNSLSFYVQQHILIYYYDFELPDSTSELKNKNFLMRMLYKQCGCSSSLYINHNLKLSVLSHTLLCITVFSFYLRSTFFILCTVQRLRFVSYFNKPMMLKSRLGKNLMSRGKLFQILRAR